MKRGIKRSLVRPNKQTASLDDVNDGPAGDDIAVETPSAFKRAATGAGSAWKAGAVAQAQADLDETRIKLADDILSGNHVMLVDPANITDPIGSDRRADWMEQEDFRSLLQSIRENGQDTPITLWPADPEWRPDDIDPGKIDGVKFHLLAGRRRHAVAQKLGIPVRAVLAPQSDKNDESANFQMLVLRFRENEEREALSAFERMLSIGEMFETLNNETKNGKVTAVSFASRINVHESIVSRARAIHKSKDAFLNAFKNVYDMSFHDLQKAISDMTKTEVVKAKTSPKSKKILTVRKIGSRKLTVSSQGGKLSISAAGLNLDKQSLEGLGDVIAAYLQEYGSQK